MLLTMCQPESLCRPCQSRPTRKTGLTPGSLRENLMLRTSYKRVGRVERKIEDSEESKD